MTKQFEGHTEFTFEPDQIAILTKRCKAKYRLGAKAANSIPLEDIKFIDCSGWVKRILGELGESVPDGSMAQGQWFVHMGFKESTVEAGKLTDGILRLAWLPQQPGKGVGRHIAFILDGLTSESCGGRGVCRRKWTGLGWQAKCRVFVLCRSSS